MAEKKKRWTLEDPDFPKYYARTKQKMRILPGESPTEQDLEKFRQDKKHIEDRVGGMKMLSNLWKALQKKK